MKHIKLFNEEADYLSSLRAQTKAREDFERQREEEIEKYRHSGKHLSNLETDVQKRKTTDEIVEERRLLVDRAIQGILASEQGRSDFKTKLIQLLEEHGF
jgi:hypothetical protein